MNANQNTNLSVVSQVKSLVSNEDVKTKFKEVLGAKAPQFMATIITLVSASPQLKQCDPNSIMGAAYTAATFDLPIDSNLGFSAIVPYKDKAQFQMMYKGFIQLAIRTGEYEKMNCSEVYEDELKVYNPITGECIFTPDFSRCTQRMNGEEDKIVGYYAWFKLKGGFMKELYMSKEECRNHAKKYSKSYGYDLQYGKKASKWTTDFSAMAKKTVIKLLLSRWGVLSIEMQKAIVDDQKGYDENEEGFYVDNQPETAQAVDPFASTQNQPRVQPQPQVVNFNSNEIPTFDMTM